MLVANLERERIEARHATKGAPFVCPGCEAPVILKRGRLRIAHFAHAARTDCGWSKGETMPHRVAKLALVDALRLRGLRAEVEFEVATPHGMRRADVLAWHPQRDEYERGGMLAFELQHTPISLEEIEERAFSYAAAGGAQVWIPFLRKSAIEGGRLDTAGLFISPGYSPRLFDDWVIEHDWRDGIRRGMWMYEPEQERYYFGEFFP